MVVTAIMRMMNMITIIIVIIIMLIVIIVIISWRLAGAATNLVKRWPDSEQAYPGD